MKCNHFNCIVYFRYSKTEIPPTWGNKFTRMQHVYSKIDSM